jgi:hypothetical protein
MLDPRRLRPCELCRSLINSTPLGEVISERQLYLHRTRAGLRIGDVLHVNLLGTVAWLVSIRHTPRAQPVVDLFSAVKLGKEMHAAVDIARSSKGASQETHSNIKSSTNRAFSGIGSSGSPNENFAKACITSATSDLSHPSGFDLASEGFRATKNDTECPFPSE